MTDSDSDHKIESEDAALFREITRDVRPLNKDNRADTYSQRARSEHIKDSFSELSLSEEHSSIIATDKNDPLLEMVQPEERLFYLRGELPGSTLKKFKRGDLCSRDELDLHGLNSVEAARELASFIRFALHNGVRCFRLIHGKGTRSADKLPILKSMVNMWLRHHGSVLAFCSARQRDGGSGALYVLLKRPDI
ncbi:MAG: Smr/MutS family protein [Gammaproteobacteria bacterium]|uniref:Smr/MutS family protein n=1 Tax=Candidatus Thiopontia autotrophica TaxID=2841688 RepID=A0A8J6P0V1_9GAMM|nr:Smr/MutS family protein [Candidatus Thiopontia autotrophica]MBL6968901.1 Smr/MutS family protein [Gammaproteobacteria bacterium]